MEQTLNLLTVDLEDWFMADVLSERFSFDTWDGLTSTIIPNSRRLLDLFARYNVAATWFVLGWSAQRYPQLMREIFDRGHEIACHSYRHLRVDGMDANGFRKDTEMAIEAIVDAIGLRPLGYRAPSWSINSTIPWAFETLAQLGFEYDSSVFPVKHDIYGEPGGPRQMFTMHFENGRSLCEIPASTYRLFGRNIPVAGGGFFRHAPYWYSSRMIRALNWKFLPAVVYVHPWEIDPEPPRVEGLSFLQRYRSYGSTSVMYRKLERLLNDFRFTTMSDYLHRHKKRQIGFR